MSRHVFQCRAWKTLTVSSFSVAALLLAGCGRRSVASAPEDGSSSAILGNGDRVFSSPRLKPEETWTTPTPCALFVQHDDHMAQRITFGIASAVQPTVLRDGRVLFVSAREPRGTMPRLGLFTVNSDGTELTAFAVNDDGAPFIASPRQLDDGRVAFLASSNADMSGAWIETVREARPFLSRTKSLPGESLPHTKTPHRPAGHLSAMTPTKHTGTLLCLDAKFARPTLASNASHTAKLRVLSGANSEPLGEVPLEVDGSFQIEVPADTPLGFEALDSAGHVLVRLAPAFWVRPGENRSCVGCHEPYNHSPENIRPIAATKPPVSFAATKHLLAQRKR